MKTLTTTTAIVVLMFANAAGNGHGYTKHDDSPGKRIKLHIQFAAVI